MFRKLVGAAAVAGALLTGPAFAHAKLTHTSPADGAQLTEAPTALTLSFAEAVKLAALTVEGAGTTVPLTIDRTAKATATIVVPLPALSPGRYEVRWSAMSPGDGHVMKGSLTFTIMPAKH
jgi:methionine-rich copper-binding protein CopC